MIFLFKNFVQFDTAHSAAHSIFTEEAYLCQPKGGWPVSLCFGVFCQFISHIKHLQRSHHLVQGSFESDFTTCRQYVLKKIKKCTHLKTYPVGNIADQINHSWCLLKRCLNSVFQYTHPFANNLRQSPNTFSLESTNRFGCLHSNTSRRMAHQIGRLSHLWKVKKLE